MLVMWIGRCMYLDGVVFLVCNLEEGFCSMWDSDVIVYVKKSGGTQS